MSPKNAEAVPVNSCLEDAVPRRAGHPEVGKTSSSQGSPVKQELECFQLIEIFLPAVLDARCPRVPHRAAPGTGGFQFENLVPGYFSLLLQQTG